MTKYNKLERMARMTGAIQGAPDSCHQIVAFFGGQMVAWRAACILSASA
jgi:hypothetical protein